MKPLFTTLLAALVLLACGCKNDSEDDYVAFLRAQTDKPQTDEGTADTHRSDSAGTSAPSGQRAIRLNELDGNAKFIELYNLSDAAVDIAGMGLVKDEQKTVYIAPRGTVIAPRAFLVLHGNAEDYGHGFTSGLSADKATRIDLLDSAGTLIDTFANPPSDPTGTWQDKGLWSGKAGQRSFSRFPDGTGGWHLAASTPEGANGDGDAM